MNKKMPKTMEASASALQGFTLVEMVIAMGILSIMAAAVSGAFSSGFSTYGSSRELQRNLESAQYAMNTLEKFLRTSTVSPDMSDGTVTTIRFYEYSSRRCFQYRFVAGTTNVLFAQWYPTVVASPTCAGGAEGTYTALTPVTTGHVSGSFSVVKSTSSPKKMGRVTVNLVVKKSAASTLEARIQATASLRDYSNVGF